MTGAITLAAAAVASVGVGVYSAVQAGKISGAARGQSNTVFNEQQYYQQQLQQLIADPSSVKNLPGYQFQFEQGSEAIARKMGATGFGGSGNEAAALAQYGQGLASSFYGQQEQILANLSGITAPSSPSQLTGAGVAAQQSQSAQINQLLEQLGIGAGLTGRFSGAGTPGASSAAGSPYTMGVGGGYTINTPGPGVTPPSTFGNAGMGATAFAYDTAPQPAPLLVSPGG